jgi:hypothetical protein
MQLLQQALVNEFSEVTVVDVPFFLPLRALPRFRCRNRVRLETLIHGHDIFLRVFDDHRDNYLST